MKILLLEDEPALRSHIEEYLTLHGYRVTSYSDGSALIEQIRPEEFALFILDVNVPGYSGFEILEYFDRLGVTVPTVFITALTQVDDIKTGFELGCADYIKKPFELEELLIRIGKLLKKENNHCISLGEGYVFDMKHRQLLQDDTVVKLSKTHKNILFLLLKYRGELITYEQLVDYVWEGKFIQHNTILSNMRGLRRQIPRELIKNYREEGYMIP